MTEYEGKESQFNEAMFKMKRIHESQNVINRLRHNLLEFSNDFNKYHYEVIASELLSLLHECYGKMSGEYKELVQLWDKKVNDLFNYFPIYENVRSEGYDTKSGVQLNHKNWNIVRESIFHLENFTRDMVEKHGFASPNIEEEEGW